MKHHGISALVHHRGFTLVESLVALILLVMIASGAGVLMSSNIETNRRVSRDSTAINLAMDKLEELRATAHVSAAGYGTVTDSSSDETLDAGGDTWQQGDGPQFTRSWTVAVNTPVNLTKTIVVTVSWSDTDGTDSVSLNTIVQSPAA